MTAGHYKIMGFTDLAAEDEQSFVKLAIRAAGDALFRAWAMERIKERSKVLFENSEAVRELERFFIAAHKTAQEGAMLEGLGLEGFGLEGFG